MITLTFPDGAKRQVEAGTSAAQVAQSISKSLEKKAVAALVNGALVDLAEPIAPVCRDDCQGLCPACGEPLDEGRHDHPAEPLDPRLEALRSFRVDDDDQTG